MNRSGNKIKKIREAQRTSQENLAKHTKISQALLSSYEVGKSKPGIDNAIKISQALGLSVEEVFGSKETKVKKFIDELGIVSKDERKLLLSHRHIQDKVEKGLLVQMAEVLGRRRK